MLHQARGLLKRIYGYDDFRPGQERVIHDILSGQDTVGIMPTGGGKSICYQIPALLLPGTTLVISPLISLMKDQVDALAEVGVSAAYLNSSLGWKDTRETMAKAVAGKYKLLYIAPERLEADNFGALVQGLTIPFIAIDEAHCVSQWGHDFRTSYVRIASFIESLPTRPKVGAFTATATDEVRQDICKQLGLQQPCVHITGFDRPNLTFSVLRGVNREAYLRQYIKEHRDEAGIIYTATRKVTDQVHGLLSEMGIAVGKYHAGMSDQEREQQQQAFLQDDVRVMVATNAFGMGIDKSNVRYVFHWNMPKNMEAYYQEAGRAGRDGEPGECILFFQPQDILTQKFLIEQSVSSPERKALELSRLRRTADYCHTRHCLRRYILEYFGQAVEQADCGRCGNCNDDGELEDITIEAQKIISCVRRMNERFGITLVAQVLKGSSNKRVLELGLEKLSTYGLMKERTEKEVYDLIQLLVADGYLGLSDSQYPILSLQPSAVGVIKGEEKVFRRSHKVRSHTQEGEDMFQLLRSLRKKLADEQGVPPYVVFSDSTLREMAIRKPITLHELLQIKGVGESKLERYGDAFLAVLRGELETSVG
ncbi:DNA helicase RecQ [Ammoniphilus sp. YIM 78166]|uniref:DNA helicase RecQ n=1 Tax=Ammoniphilus sp. YIM 78166 TaxID=1644106 RepID=UPI00106F85E8|nr:DNA helicase RecQ [Ammoniphilus sp. YIM 78166]